MFKNIGKKIKGLAKFLCWVGIIVSVIAGIGIILGGNLLMGELGGTGAYRSSVSDSSILALSGVLTMAIGSLISWVSSFVLYGFGELVDNSTEIKELLKK